MRGFSVIPLRPGDKRPQTRWEAFQTNLPTEVQVQAAWAHCPDANVGIVTGRVSGIIVLDVDGAAGRESIRGKHLPPTPTCKTPRGGHYYYRHPGGHVPNAVGLLPGIDLRADGGYVVTAPSVNAEGVRYEWCEGLRLDEVDLAPPPQWLLDLLAKKEPAPVAVPVAQGADVLQGVPEGQRNNTAARIAGRVLKAGLNPQETEEFLLFWNRKNKPPLPEEEVRAVARSISARHVPAGAPPAAIPAKFAVPISALMSEPDVEIDYLVEPLVEAGTIGFDGGEPKLAKSWLALAISLGIATGTPVMDTFRVPLRRRVLYIQEEDSASLVRRRIHLLCRGHGIPLPDDQYFRCAVRTGFQIDDPVWFAALCKEVEEFRPSLVVADVLNKLHSQDENEQSGMTLVMRQFEEIRRKFGCAFLIVHHFRKGDASRGNQRLRGSSVLGGWSECSLYLSPGDNGTLRVERESKAAQTEPFSFRLEDLKDADGHLVGVRLVHLGEAVVTPKDSKGDAFLRAVLEAHAEGGEAACTADALAARAKVSANTIRTWMQKLSDRVHTHQIRNADGREVTVYTPITVSGSTNSTQNPGGAELLSRPEGVKERVPTPPFPGPEAA